MVYAIAFPHRDNFVAKEDRIVAKGAACLGSRRGLPPAGGRVRLLADHGICQRDNKVVIDKQKCSENGQGNSKIWNNNTVISKRDY